MSFSNWIWACSTTHLECHEHSARQWQHSSFHCCKSNTLFSLFAIAVLHCNNSSTTSGSSSFRGPKHLWFSWHWLNEEENSNINPRYWTELRGWLWVRDGRFRLSAMLFQRDFNKLMFRFQEVFWDIMKALLYMIIREARRNCRPDVVTPPSRHIHSGGGQTPRGSQSYLLKPAFARCSYRRGVRCPGQEDPFVALVVSGVQPVQNVGGDLVVEQGLY